MKTLTPAAQLFTVRAFTQDVPGFRDTLRKVAEIGYPTVQISAIGPIPAPEIKAALEENHLTCCVTHSSFDRMQTDLPAMIAEHQLFGCPLMGIGAMPEPYRDSAEGFREFARIIRPIAQELKENGMRLTYHNHSFEFQRFDGKLGIDILFEETDPEAVEFVLDSYWIQSGGCNPVDYIRKAQGRMTVFHLKDMQIHGWQQRFAPIFEGNLDFPAMFAACRDTGVRYIAVEQDDCYGEDPFDCLARSYRNIMANL